MTDSGPQNADRIAPNDIGVNTAEHPTVENNDLTWDIKRFAQILFLHKWILLLVALLVLIIAILFALNQPKYYESDYEVFYNESTREIISQNNLPTYKTEFNKSFWSSTMKSDYMAKLIVQNSGLPITSEMVKRMFSVEMVEKKDQTIPIIKVSIRAKRNDIFPILIKAFVKSLNDILLANQINSSDKLVTYLTQQLTDNNRKLGDIDRNLIFDGVSHLAKTKDLGKMSSDLESFRTDLLNSQISLASAMATKQKAEMELKGLDGTIVNESAFSEPMKVQLMNLQVDLARALTKDKENHPSIKAIRDNIAHLQTMLRDSIQEKLEIKSLVQNPLKSQLMSKLTDLELNVIALQTRVLSLQQVIGEFEHKMVPDSLDENTQQKLRNREQLGTTINLLNAKLIEAQSVAQGPTSHFVLIDEPGIPTTPSTKSKMLIVLFGFLAGLFLGALAVFIYDLLDNRLKLVSDYEKFFTIPLLGVIFHKYKPEEYYANRNNVNSSYRKMNELNEVVVNIKEIIDETGKKTFSICSPMRREGKSMMSMQMAYALADKGLKVLLVDIDMFIPKLTIKFSMKHAPGLINLVKGENTTDEIIHSTDNAGLWFTGVGNSAERKGFNYDSPKFISFVNEAKQKFDIVLFDTPAIIYIPDVVSFLKSVDGIFIVTRLMHTTRMSLDRMLKMMGRHKAKVTGTLINDLKLNPITKHTEYYNYSYEGRSYNDGIKVKKQKKIEKKGVAQVA